jgi:hypothetical protein
MFMSIHLDLPTGAAIVVSFGAMLALLGIIKLAFKI